MEEKLPQVKKFIKYGIAGIAGIVVFFMLISMFRTVEAGYTDHYQNTFTGTQKIYHGPDWYLSPVFVGTESTWKDDTTVSFSSENADKYSSNNPPIGIRFADTYEAKLPLAARLVLPSDDEHMFMVVKSFRSYENLVNSLYVKTLGDVVVNTAQQFTAEEVTQGGLNSLKSAIEDQANKGVYVTERKRILMESSGTKRLEPGEDKTDTKVTDQEITVWKAVPKLDKDGKVLRTSNPFEKYGIAVLQVNLADPIPEELLEKLLVTKKTSVAKKILSVQLQDNAKEDIKTAQLEGQAAREKAEQERMIIADAEIIEMKKQVQVAQQQAKKEIVEQQKLADLAVIDKKKELQISKSNKDIEIANEIAARYKAQASLHAGLAAAQIKKAKYAAIDKVIFMAEVDRDKTIALAKGLKNFKIDMPTYMSTGSDGKASDANSLKIVMDTIGIKNLQELNTKTK